MEKKAQKNWKVIALVSFVLIIVLVFLVYLLIKTNSASSGKTQIADPSAVYCQDSGYQYKIITSSDGSQRGVCIFPDGSECDSWSYFCGCSNDMKYCGMAYPKCNHGCN